MSSVFERSEGGPLYFWSGSPGADIAIAFRPGADPGAASLTLTESWTAHPGVYLFLGGGADGPPRAAFERALSRLLDDPVHRETRFVWLENPADPLAAWRLQRIALTESDGTRTVARLASLDLRNYSLSLARGSRCALDDGGEGFTFTRAAGNPRGFFMTTGFGAHRLQGVGATVGLPFADERAGCLEFALSLQRDESSPYSELTRLDPSFRIFFKDPAFPGSGDAFAVRSRRYPMLGEDAESAARYPADVTLVASLDPLRPLDAGRSHFAFPGAVNGTPAAAFPSGFRTTLGYWIYLAARDRSSRLVFAERPASSRPDAHAPLYLTPAGDFRMTVPRHGAGGGDGSIRSEDSLLCGISSLEYLRLDSDSDAANWVRFVPGQKAFAPAFVTVEAMIRKILRLVADHAGVTPDELGFAAELQKDLGIAVADDDPVEGLTLAEILELAQTWYFPAGFRIDLRRAVGALAPPATLGEMLEWLQKELQAAAAKGLGEGEPFTELAGTSWAYVWQETTNGGNPVYYAQPDRAVLYEAPERPDATPDDPRDDILEYMEVPAVGLPPPGDGRLFPLFPYGGVGGAWLADYRQLELQWVSALRRARIHAISEEVGHAVPLAPDGNGGRPHEGATPQGLRATYSSDFESLERVILAKGTDNRELLLQDLPRASPLRAALQSNQLFLVISRPDQLREFFAQDELTIQDWVFDVDPESWKKHGTLMVFKFHDKPLSELVENTNAWTLPVEFNQSPSSVRRKLAGQIAEAIAKAESDDLKDREKYGPLARAARLEGWSGILALNVAVPELPDQIKGLSGGIDQDRFFADYVGIETTPIKRAAGGLEAGQSSLFGLIDYEDDTAPLPTDSGYNFQVTKLSALFVNSQLADFSSELAVTLDRLFDEPTRLVDSPTGRNIVILKGTAEEHDGRVTYSFSFAGDNHFALPESEVIGEVEILKAQFTTDPVTSTTITSRFSFWGRINFRLLEAFDVLSFGAEEPAAADNDKYLAFSGLQVIMSFPEADPETRTFEFDPRNLAFDLRASKVRDQSLFAKFPLKLNGLIYSQGERTTDEDGYMPVSTPLSGSLGPTWYGLTFDLKLGTLGALAGSAAFTVGLIAAWSPSGAAGGGVYVGLRLPGSTGGKKEIPIQGVLKIVFKRIQFVAARQDGATAYLLKLKNIKLKFLVLSIPPTGQSEIIIFGNPAGVTGDKALGWYAAYAKKK